MIYINYVSSKSMYSSPDDMETYKKVSKIQKKKRELEADFKGNLSDKVFEESEIENYQWQSIINDDNDTFTETR